MGAIFYGCRVILRTIYDSLSTAKINYISIPHIISYSIFYAFVFAADFLLIDRIIALMIWLQNPPSD